MYYQITKLLIKLLESFFLCTGEVSTAPIALKWLEGGFKSFCEYTPQQGPCNKRRIGNFDRLRAPFLVPFSALGMTELVNAKASNVMWQNWTPFILFLIGLPSFPRMVRPLSICSRKKSLCVLATQSWW